jgi:hypothetical protein
MVVGLHGAIDETHGDRPVFSRTDYSLAILLMAFPHP